MGGPASCRAVLRVLRCLGDKSRNSGCKLSQQTNKLLMRFLLSPPLPIDPADVGFFYFFYFHLSDWRISQQTDTVEDLTPRGDLE